MIVLALSAHRGLRRQHDAENLRRYLASQAEDFANLVAESTHRPTIERIEQCLMLLDGVRFLGMKYRSALLEELGGGQSHDI